MMTTTSPLSLTHSLPMGMNVLESSLQELLPDALTPNPIEHQSEPFETERQESQLLDGAS